MATPAERIIAAGLLWSGHFLDAKVSEVREVAEKIADALEHPERYPWAQEAAATEGTPADDR